jgi:hypothetical protein
MRAPPSGGGARIAWASRNRGLIGWVVVCITIAVSVGVGFTAAHPPATFEWDVAAIVGTALGTLALAVSTGFLALSSRDDVQATKQLADLAREDQRVRSEPQIILHHARIVTGGQLGAERLFLSVEFKNVGLGPALDVRIHARQTARPITLDFDSFLWPVLAPGEATAISIPASFCEGISLDIDDAMVVDALNRHAFEVYGDCTDRQRARR